MNRCYKNDIEVPFFKIKLHHFFILYFQRGWQKWGHNYQDFYAQKADATSPDWYSRRTNTIRGGDIKELLWPYEGTSKPTEKKTFGITKDPPIQWRKGYRAVPHDIEGQVVVPRWGLYHPGHYECPGRAEQLPAIHPDEKHL